MKEVVSLGSLKTVEEAFDVTRTDMHDLLEGGLLLFEEAMVAMSMERGLPCAKVFSSERGVYWVFDRELVLSELNERFGLSIR